MAKITINVGSAANDGTGDTLRGAFQNVNANFTELYASVANTANLDLSQYYSANASFSTANLAYGIANLAYDKANTANLLAYQSNSYTLIVGAASNAWANVVVTSGNNYTNTVGTASNTWANTVGTAGNNYTNAVGTAGNNYVNSVGSATNNYTNSVGTAGNNYTNSSIVEPFTRANDAYTRANTAWDYANTVNTYVTLKGPYDDDSSASSNGVAVMGLYYTAQGNVKIRLV